MKHFTFEKTGRTFVLRLEKGDLLREKIIELCALENVTEAVVLSGIAALDIVNIQMSNTKGFPIEYDVINLEEAIELGSLAGTIVNGEPHIHGVFGNGIHSWAGHVLDGCRILYLGEIVIQELIGPKLIRKPNEDGLLLISKKD